MSLKKIFPLVVALSMLCMACPCTSAHAASGDGKTTNEFRYEFTMIDGVMHRMDKQSGDVEYLDPIIKKWKAGVYSAALVASAKTPKHAEEQAPDVHNDEPQQEEGQKPNGLRIESINGEPVDPNYVPDKIKDDHRLRASKDIKDYMPRLGLTELLAIQENGTVISGTISVKNKGIKKLSALELTVIVPIGKEKKEHRHPILLSYDSAVRPPQPADSPTEPAKAEFVRVNFPSPEGMVSGPIRVEVTYLKFAK